MLKKQTKKKKTTFPNLNHNQTKDLQEMLKRRMEGKKTDTEPPLTKNMNHRTTKEIKPENTASVEKCQKKN